MRLPSRNDFSTLNEFKAEHRKKIDKSEVVFVSLHFFEESGFGGLKRAKKTKKRGVVKGAGDRRRVTFFRQSVCGIKFGYARIDCFPLFTTGRDENSFRFYHFSFGDRKRPRCDLSAPTTRFSARATLPRRENVASALGSPPAAVGFGVRAPDGVRRICTRCAVDRPETMFLGIRLGPAPTLF